MSGARHPSREHVRVGDRIVLAGDMHTHVLPPDHPSHVSRDFEDTAELAKKEGLDFVVLTPHIPSRFYMREDKRRWVLETQEELRAKIAPGDTLFVPGFEYTDHLYGHVGAGFADVKKVLAEVPLDASPEVFFQRWVANGGVLTINHPVEHPIGTMGPLAWDLSWRGFSDAPPEIAWLTNHAQTVETYNAMVSNLRDRIFMNDPDRSLRESWHITEEMSRAQHRAVVPVGGTDSHGHWLRATTFVLAKEKSEKAIRDALVEGRVCVRGPEACTLEVRGKDGWVGVGESIEAGNIEARSPHEMTLYINGEVVGRGTNVRAKIQRCSFVRAVVGESWSAPIRVGCGF